MFLPDFSLGTFTAQRLDMEMRCLHGEMLGAARVVRLGDVDIAYTELGDRDRPPLVMLHGLADTHRTFRRVAPLLAERYRVLMPDLPGHGWSSRPINASYDAAWYADVIGRWMAAVGVSRAAICGHSLGGGIALRMLQAYRSKIDRLALVAPGGLGREVSLWLRIGTWPIARALLGSLPARRILTSLAVRFGPARFSRPEPDEIRRYHDVAARPGTALALHRTINACVDRRGQRITFWDEASALESLPPIAVFWGELDPVVPFAHAKSALRRLVHSTVHSYPNCGHFPHLDVPERFASELDVFMSDATRPCCCLAPVETELSGRVQSLIERAVELTQNRHTPAPTPRAA